MAYLFIFCFEQHKITHSIYNTVHNHSMFCQPVYQFGFYSLITQHDLSSSKFLSKLITEMHEWTILNIKYVSFMVIRLAFSLHLWGWSDVTISSVHAAYKFKSLKHTQDPLPLDPTRPQINSVKCQVCRTVNKTKSEWQQINRALSPHLVKP